MAEGQDVAVTGDEPTQALSAEAAEAAVAAVENGREGDTADESSDDDISVEAPIIDGRYEVLSVLGEGGFGVVYKGRQISTGQIVAIKLLHADLMEDEGHRREYIARFEREMKVIGSMKHPNIVRLIDKGVVENGELFMALEFIDGKSLFDVIQAEGPLSLAETMHLMLQVLDALHAAHCLGIVHRDLKPHNIMLTSTGYRRNAMVLDFGIAGVVEGARGTDYRTLTKASEIRGTPAYMAPEQLRTKKLTPQIDLYAWGLVFLECLAGEPVVPGETPFDIALWQVGDDPVEIPDSIAGDGLRAILERVSSKKMDVRYKSAAEVFEAFEDLDLSGLAGASATAVAVAAANPHRRRNIENEKTAAFDERALDRKSSPAHTPSRRERGPEAHIATTMLDGEAIERAHQTTLTGSQSLPAGSARPSAASSGTHAAAVRTGPSPGSVALLAVLLTALVGGAVAWIAWPSPGAQNEVSAADDADAGAQREQITATTDDVSLRSLLDGISRLEEQLTRVPDDAVALGGLARLHALMASYGWSRPDDHFTQARELARRALEKAPDQPDAHLALALVGLALERDLTAAEASFRRAAELDPSLGADYARFLLAPLQRFDEAATQLAAARTAAPGSVRVALAAAHVDFLAGRFDQAIAQADGALAIKRDAFLAHYERGLAHLAANRLTDAQAAFDTARTMQDESMVLAALGYTYARAGNTSRARELLELLEAKAAVDGRVLPEHIAWIYAGLGELDPAFEWLDKALAGHSAGLVELATNPLYSVLAADPRMQRLSVRAGLKAP